MKQQLTNITTKSKVRIPATIVVNKPLPKVITRPAITTDQAAGMFKDKIKKRDVRESAYEKAISDAVAEKFEEGALND